MDAWKRCERDRKIDKAYRTGKYTIDELAGTFELSTGGIHAILNRRNVPRNLHPRKARGSSGAQRRKFK